MFVLKLLSSSHVESFSSGFIPRILERFGIYMSDIALEATSPSVSDMLQEHNINVSYFAY